MFLVKNTRVIGVHMLGNPSSEVLGACIAIEQEMTLKDARGGITLLARIKSGVLG